MTAVPWWAWLLIAVSAAFVTYAAVMVAFIVTIGVRSVRSFDDEGRPVTRRRPR